MNHELNYLSNLSTEVDGSYSTEVLPNEISSVLSDKTKTKKSRTKQPTDLRSGLTVYPNLINVDQLNYDGTDKYPVISAKSNQVYDQPFITQCTANKPFKCNSDDVTKSGMQSFMNIPRNEFMGGNVNKQFTQPFLGGNHVFEGKLANNTTVYGSNEPLDYSNMFHRPAKDDMSIESLSERSLTQFKQPGHLVAGLAAIDNKDSYYTVNTNSCGGVTPSDDMLWNQCTALDMSLKAAIDGNPKKMLGCVGDCGDVINSKLFYTRFPKEPGLAGIYDQGGNAAEN